jgi:uncharacterized membrane protein
VAGAVRVAAGPTGRVASATATQATWRAAAACRQWAPRATFRSMEFLNFVLILAAGWLVWRRPERERLAFGLLVASCVIMMLLFLVGTRGSIVPGVNL